MSMFITMNFWLHSGMFARQYFTFFLSNLTLFTPKAVEDGFAFTCLYSRVAIVASGMKVEVPL